MDELMQELETMQENIDGALEAFDEGDHNEEIARHFDQLLDIRLALESMIENDGINRELATSLEAYLPEDLPKNSFTRSFTQTNLETTVVSLEEKNWGIIAMIGIAIAGLIAKIIMWLFDRKNGSSASSAEKAEKIAGANEKVAESTPEDQRREIEKKINDSANGYWNAYLEACAIEPTRKMMDFFALEKALYTNRSSSLIEDATLLLESISSSQGGAESFANANKLLEKQRKRISEDLGYRGLDIREALIRFEGELQELENQSGKPFSIATYNSLHGQRSNRPGTIAKVSEERGLDVDSHQSKELKKKLEKLKDKAEELEERNTDTTGKSAEAKRVMQDKANALRNVQDTLNVLTKYFTVRSKLLAADMKCQKDLLGEYRKALDTL